MQYVHYFLPFLTLEVLQLWIGITAVLKCSENVMKETDSIYIYCK